MVRRFRDRREAGRRLAAELQQFAGRPDVIILGLPRGGVPVAFEVASALHAPLDVFVVRKLGAPGYEELAMGAIATGGAQVVNRALMEDLGIDEVDLEQVVREEKAELVRRERLYRGSEEPPFVADRVVILVDDGLATGASMLAAVAALRTARPRRIVVAVPIAAPQTCAAGRGSGLRAGAGGGLRGEPVVRRLLADDRRGGARTAGCGEKACASRTAGGGGSGELSSATALPATVH